MNECKNNVLRSQIDLYNWTDNYLNDIKQDMSSIRGVYQNLPAQKKRNISTVFDNSIEPEDLKLKKKKDVYHRVNKSMVFSNSVQTQEAKPAKKVYSNVNNSNEIQTMTTLGTLQARSSKDVPKIINLKKRVNAGNMTSPQNPLAAASTKPKVKCV